jgi:hypothetical protein
MSPLFVVVLVGPTGRTPWRTGPQDTGPRRKGAVDPGVGPVAQIVGYVSLTPWGAGVSLGV